MYSFFRPLLYNTNTYSTTIYCKANRKRKLQKDDFSSQPFSIFFHWRIYNIFNLILKGQRHEISSSLLFYWPAQFNSMHFLYGFVRFFVFKFWDTVYRDELYWCCCKLFMTVKHCHTILVLQWPSVSITAFWKACFCEISGNHQWHR
jgi:hypothetical protein